MSVDSKNEGKFSLATSVVFDGSFEDRKKTLLKEFQPLLDWEARYKKIISWGKAYPDLPEDQKTEEAKVKGCQSQVWLHAHRGEKGEVIFEGDSDALLVKGLVVLLMGLYSGLPAEEILRNPPEVLKELGFESNLSPSRANGLNSMIKQMKTFAMAFWMMDQAKKK